MIETIPHKFDDGGLHTYHGVHRDAEGKLKAGCEMLSVRGGPVDVVPLIAAPREAAGQGCDIISLHRDEHDAWFDRNPKSNSESQHAGLSSRDVYRTDPFSMFHANGWAEGDLRDSPLLVHRDGSDTKGPRFERRASIVRLQFYAAFARTKMLNANARLAAQPASIASVLQKFGTSIRIERPERFGTLAETLEELSTELGSFIGHDEAYRKTLTSRINSKQARTMNNVLDATRRHIREYVASLGKHAAGAVPPLPQYYGMTGITTTSLAAEMSLIAERRVFDELDLDPGYKALREPILQARADERERNEQLRLAREQRNAQITALVSNLVQRAQAVGRNEYESLLKQRLQPATDRIMGHLKPFNSLFGFRPLREATLRLMQIPKAESRRSPQQRELLARYRLGSLEKIANDSLRKQIEQDRCSDIDESACEHLERYYRAFKDWALTYRRNNVPGAANLIRSEKRWLDDLAERVGRQYQRIVEAKSLAGLTPLSENEIRSAACGGVKSVEYAEVHLRSAIAEMANHLEEEFARLAHNIGPIERMVRSEMLLVSSERFIERLNIPSKADAQSKS